VRFSPINAAARYLADEAAISQGSLCRSFLRVAAGNPITPGRLDEPRYISGNGPNHTNSRYVMTARYLFVTVHTTQQFAEGLLGR